MRQIGTPGRQMSRNGEAAPTPRRREPFASTETIDVARGLLLALALLPVAALAAPASAPGAGALSIIGLLGDVLIAPAFVFLAGLEAGRAGEAGDAGRFSNALALALATGLVGALAGILIGAGARAGVDHVAPALRLVLAPLLYAVATQPLRRASAATALAVAVFVHVVGVLPGGPTAAMLGPFPFFVAGVLMAARGARLADTIAAEPEFAAASGPLLIAVAVISVALAPPGVATIATLGPPALPLGLAAGPALIAGARALAMTRAAPLCARLGRAAGLLALFWLPLFYALPALAQRGVAASPASLVLFSAASLLAIVSVADISLDMRIRRRGAALR